MNSETFYDLLTYVENLIKDNVEFNVSQVTEKFDLQYYELEYAFKKYLLMHFDSYVIKKRTALRKNTFLSAEIEFYEQYGYTMKKNYQDAINLMKLIDKIICDNLSSVTVESIAKATNREAKTIETLFVEQMQITIKEYIIKKRLAKAAELLINTSKPIPEIFQESGFKNNTTFNDAFTKYYNYSPQRYRSKFSVIDQETIIVSRDNSKDTFLLSQVEIRCYISENFATVNIGTIAHHFNCDQTDLRTKFSDKFDISLSEYITKQRINAICLAINAESYDPTKTFIEDLVKEYGYVSFDKFLMVFENHMNEPFMTYYERILQEINKKKATIVETLEKIPAPNPVESSPDLIPEETIPEQISEAEAIPKKRHKHKEQNFEYEALQFDMILEHMIANNPNICVESVCKTFTIDQKYLDYLFEFFYNLSARKYIVYIRTLYAADLLLQGQNGLTIATNVLKISYPQFRYDIEKIFNCSPSEYQALNGILLNHSDETHVVLNFKK